LLPVIPESRRFAATAALIGGVAFLWRLRLTSIYFGSEEEDYGNLGLILGTLQSGFRYVETEHMPLFTALAAAVTGIVKDAEVGGEIVALISGTAVVLLTLRIGWSWLSPAAGVIAALLLIGQPELSLYSATPLRITTYVAFVLLAVWAIGERRQALAAAALALGFLTRFDLAFSLLPAVLVWTAWKGQGSRAKRWAPAAVATLTVVAWAAWYHAELGTWRFWGGVAERNEATELNPGTLLAFATHIIPDHLGRVAALASLAGATLMLRGRALDPEKARWLLLGGSSVVGLLCGTVLLSSYDWNHNLYWKWMSTSLPFLALGAGHAATTGYRFLRARGGVARWAAIGLTLAALVETGASQVIETRDQLARTDLWYGTQVRLVRWIEAEFPDDVGVLADLIPATYLSRKDSPRRIHLWRQSELPPGDEAAFAEFVRAERISLVFWFREEWVGATERAPWLADPEPKVIGGVRLLPIAAEDGYGFVAWQVIEPGLPDASSPPPLNAGATEFVGR
jgi:hypothetical protein